MYIIRRYIIYIQCTIFGDRGGVETITEVVVGGAVRGDRFRGRAAAAARDCVTRVTIDAVSSRGAPASTSTGLRPRRTGAVVIGPIPVYGIIITIMAHYSLRNSSEHIVLY